MDHVRDVCKEEKHHPDPLALRTASCHTVGDKEVGSDDRTQASCRISDEYNRSLLISFRIQPAEYGHIAESSSLSVS